MERAREDQGRWTRKVGSNSQEKYLLLSDIHPLFRSIGVSNFNESNLKILFASAKMKPAVNQVRHLSHTLPVSNIRFPLIRIRRSSFIRMFTGNRLPSFLTRLATESSLQHTVL
jgi:hypothetical protein